VKLLGCFPSKEAEVDTLLQRGELSLMSKEADSLHFLVPSSSRKRERTRRGRRTSGLDSTSSWRRGEGGGCHRRLCKPSPAAEGAAGRCASLTPLPLYSSFPFSGGRRRPPEAAATATAAFGGVPEIRRVQRGGLALVFSLFLPLLPSA